MLDKLNKALTELETKHPAFVFRDRTAIVLKQSLKSGFMELDGKEISDRDQKIIQALNFSKPLIRVKYEKLPEICDR